MTDKDLAGKAGATEVLEALAKSPMTFTELARSVNVHTLQRRLREFMKQGLILRRILDDRRVQYQLTPRGLELAARAQAVQRVAGAGLERLMGESYEPFLKEWNAYWATRDQIIRKYPGQFVAVCGGEICAVADTLVEAALEAERKLGPKPMYVAKVGEELAPYMIRSPKALGEKSEAAR